MTEGQPRPPATDEEREDETLTLRPLGQDRQASLFPGFRQLGRAKGTMKRESLRRSRR